jgi:hypothetical protein
MLRFVDGFDAMDASGYLGGASGLQLPAKYYDASVITGDQIAMVGGRFGGQALQQINTGFASANYVKAFAAQTQWAVGFAFQLHSGLAGSDPLFYTLAAANLATQVVGLAYETATGKLLVYRNGGGTNASKGTLVKNTGVVLPNSSWTYLEIFVIVAGASSVLQVFQDDVAIADYGPTGTDGTINLGAANIDRACFRWESLGTAGYYIDDYYIADGTGALNNTRLGPCRIMSETVIGDASLSGGWVRNGGATDTDRVNEYPPGSGHGVPDWLFSYLAGTASCSDLFNVASPQCVGRILGVAVNATCQGFPPASVALLCQPIGAAGSAVTLASLSPPAGGSDWACLQGIAEQDLATGASFWTDGDIGRAWWGAGLSSGAANMTQIYLEKLVSLRAVSFDCGVLNSYAV